MTKKNNLPYATPVDGSAPACLIDGKTAREILGRQLDIDAVKAELDRRARRNTAERILIEIERVLSAFKFTPVGEADLQRQVLRILYEQKDLVVRSEVRSDAGRYDVFVEALGVCVVLELKTKGSVNAVERQAQRYALHPGVDAVAIVTTSARLAHAIAAIPGGIDELGGKLFQVISLRTL